VTKGGEVKTEVEGLAQIVDSAILDVKMIPRKYDSADLGRILIEHGLRIAKCFLARTNTSQKDG